MQETVDQTVMGIYLAEQSIVSANSNKYMYNQPSDVSCFLLAEAQFTKSDATTFGQP